MKNIQKKRSAIQLLAVLLTTVGFFTNFQITMAVIMLGTVVGGAYYCGWVCPYGTLQEMMGKLGRKLGIKKRQMPKGIQKYLKYSRYVLMVLVTVISADFIFSMMSLDPRVNLLTLLSMTAVSVLALTIMVTFVLIALFFDRPFCNYLCSQGAKYGLISSLRVFTIKRDKESCIACGKCDRSCPMQIEVSTCDQLRSPQCINCMQCVSECPVEDTLSYGIINFSKKEVKRMGIIVVAVVMGVVIALAGGLLSGEERSSYSETETSVIEVNESQVSSGEGLYIDGTYTGTAQAFRGPMTVEVTVSDEMIQSVVVIDHSDDNKWFNRANDDIPDEIVSSQSADVDAVSGATYSSNGIINGAKVALADAMK